MPSSLDPRLLDSCIEGLAETHQLLLATVDELSVERFAEPSLLPGWSRSTLLGHLAMNAVSHVHLMACATRGEVGDQYPGGPDARQVGITTASQWEPAQTIKELRRAVYTLEGAWAGATYDAWNAIGRTASGNEVAMHELPFLRWRECVVHLTDLNVGYTHEAWPSLYVRLELERQKMAWAASHSMGMTKFPEESLKLSESTRLAWLIQRLDIEGLPQGPGL